MEFKIRYADVNDIDIIYQFIKKLADYEQLSHLVIATKESLKMSLFDLKQAEVCIGEENGLPVSFMLFFSNYSTFLGHANIYLEDFFVLEPYRHKGYGKKMMIHLAKIAVERGAKRLDWSCLDWNQKSIDFYQDLGATKKREWLLFRLENEALIQLAHKDKA